MKMFITVAPRGKKKKKTKNKEAFNPEPWA
jgi:hypothetical protein